MTSLVERTRVLVRFRRFPRNSRQYLDGWAGWVQCPVCKVREVVLDVTRRLYCSCGEAVLLVDRGG
jgi:hypothetical protein